MHPDNPRPLPRVDRPDRLATLTYMGRRTLTEAQRERRLIQRQARWRVDGLKLREARERLGLTQQQVADELGLTGRGWVCDIEAGRRGVPAFAEDSFAALVARSLVKRPEF